MIVAPLISRWFGAARRELPLGRDESASFLPWIFALMAYVAGLAGVGLIGAGEPPDAPSLATSLTLQVPAEASEARLQTVLALLQQTPGIASAHLLDRAETARLLEP